MAAEALVGREEELATLTSELALARDGMRRLVLIEGMPGIGKSALLRALIDQASPSTVLAATAAEDEADIPYAALDQLLRPLRERQPVLGDRIDEVLGTPDPLTAGTALVELLAGLDSADGVLVVLDDLHWCDPATARLLAFALRRLRSDHLLVVLAGRSHDVRPLPEVLVTLSEQLGLRLTVPGLQEEDLSALARSVGTELTAGAVRALYEHTGGNPLYALSAMSSGAGIEAATPLAAPDAYALAIARRVGTCSAAAQRLVGAAAVVGVAAGLDVLAQLAAVDDPVTALDEAVHARLLATSGSGPAMTVTFSHPLARGAAYHNLALAERQRLHLAAAERAVDEVTALRHRVAASYGRDDALATELEALAEREAGRSFASASTWAARTAAQLCTDPVRADRLTLFAIEQAVAAGDAVAVATMAPAIEQMAETPRRTGVVGILSALSGQQAVAEEALKSAWADVDRDAEPDLADTVASWLSVIMLNAGRIEEAADAPARVTMRAVRGETRVGNITSAVGSYWVADPQAAVAAVADVRLSTRSQPQEVSLVLARAVMNVWTERLDEAWSDLHQVLPVVRRRGPFVELLIAHLYLTDAAYRSGRWDDAIAHGELAVSATRDGDQVFLLALTHGAAAWARAARGDWDAAEAHCEAARQAADALGDLGSRIWSQLAAARLAHARGDAASVAAPLEELASAQHTTGLRNPAVQPWEGLFAEALVDLGRLDEAEAVVDLMDHGPGTGTLRSTASEVARIRGLLAAARREPGSAEAFLVRAVELAGPIGQPFLLARSQLALGSFFRRQGRSADAQRVLSVAERGFSRLRAGPYQERVGRELEAIGRRGAPSIELSPQERAVAVLVAEGLSNRDVAARLVISVKTVEYHVRNIYDKLGIRSRSALTRYVIEQELG